MSHANHREFSNSQALRIEAKNSQLKKRNYQYEVNINDGKRRIKVVKAEYLDTIISDMRRIMTYKRQSY